MSLHFTLFVNGEPIGREMIIQRITPQDPDEDTICAYVCRVDDQAIEGITHRYGDSVWILVAKALRAAGYEV